MKNQTRNLILIIVAVLVVAFLVIWAVFFMKPSSPASPTGSTSTSGPQPAYVAPGQLAAGFPKQLILGATTSSVSQSYSINYASSTNQYTAVWTSTISLQPLFAQYQAYLAANGWVVSHTTTTYQNSRGIYAVKGGTAVNISIIATGTNGSQVTVSY